MSLLLLGTRECTRTLLRVVLVFPRTVKAFALDVGLSGCLGAAEYARIAQPVGHAREFRHGRGFHLPHDLSSVDLDRHFAYPNIIGYLLV
jgi:hypothetical protein